VKKDTTEWLGLLKANGINNPENQPDFWFTDEMVVDKLTKFLQKESQYKNNVLRLYEFFGEIETDCVGKLLAYKNKVQYKVVKQKPISSNVEVDFPSQEQAGWNIESKKSSKRNDKVISSTFNQEKGEKFWGLNSDDEKALMVLWKEFNPRPDRNVVQDVYNFCHRVECSRKIL
jgi:hypothetical protein